jgi:hypothetical protein
LTDGKQAFKGHSQQAAEKNPDNAGVGYKQRMPSEAAGHRLEKRPRPLLKIAKRFPSGGTMICQVLAALLKFLGMERLNILEGFSLPRSHTDLP